MKSKLLISVAITTLVASQAHAADAIVMTELAPVIEQQTFQPWFLDAQVGGAFSRASALHFINPLGTEFTDNAVSGDRIILNDVDKSDSSVSANFGVGYMINPNWYGKFSYRYFGQHKYSGSADFGGDPYDQNLKVTGHGVFVGAGYIHDLTDKLYLDASGEIGASFLRSTATQGINQFPDDPGHFPSKTQTNFAAGVGLGLGYRLTESLDFTLTGTYHYLGSAKTGKTLNVEGMQDGEYLKAKNIGVAGIAAGIRVKF